MPSFKIVRVTMTIEVADDVQAANATEAQRVATEYRTTTATTSYEVTEVESATAKSAPQGFGFYLRKLSDSAADAQALLVRLQASKARWVAFMVEDVSGNQQDISVITLYSNILTQAGIKCWVWTFPGNSRAQSVVDSVDAANLAVQYCEHIHGQGVMLDVEAAYKGKSVSLNALVDTAMAKTSGTSMSVGIVSYPIPSYHPTIDWSVLSKCDWGSPMLYDSAGVSATIDRCLAEWGTYGITGSQLVPSLATYDTESPDFGATQLDNDIARVTKASSESDAIVFWSESTTDNDERAVIQQWATALEW